jgi:hypothetical protein
MQHFRKHYAYVSQVMEAGGWNDIGEGCTICNSVYVFVKVGTLRIREKN